MSVLDRLKPWRAGGRNQVVEPASSDASDDVASALRAITRHAAEGRLVQALVLINATLAKAPSNAELVSARGSVLFEWGRIREAREDLTAAAVSDLRPALLIQLGWASLWSGDATEAEGWMRRAIGADGANWQAHFALGATLRAQKRVADAIAAYCTALELSPDNAQCLAEIVDCHVECRRFDDALLAAERLRDAHPDDVSALSSYAAVLTQHDRFADASVVYDRVAALEAARPKPGDVPLDAGFPLREGRRVPEALTFYEQQLPLRPQPNAHMHYAFTLLKAGRLSEGFAQYDFRWMIPPLIAQRFRFGVPTWSGQPLEGKTVLVAGEQGYGDMIQFARYLPLLKARGARVVLLMHKPAPELFDERTGVDSTISASDPLPSFDYCAHLLSLAHVFATELQTVPRNVPYMFARDDRIALLRSRFPADDCINVGVVWAGDPLGGRGGQKSLSLRMLAPWAHMPGLRFFSLQKGEAAAEATQIAGEFPITDLSPDIRDFADTAAIIASLDLVISVCTSVAHLAGAMGKPVWTMTPEPADWRWMEDRDDTPWYPTMRLFRQPRQGDWASVVASVGDALATLARDRGAEAKAGVPSLFGVEPGATATRTVPRPNPVREMSAVIEGRHGIFQYRPDGTPSERSLARYGEDLEPQLDLLRSQILPGATVLEAGAGVGAHAVALAAHIGTTGHLLVCEPRRELSGRLQNNLGANAVVGVTTLRTSLLGTRGREASHGEDDATAGATIDQLALRKLDWLKIGEGMDADAILDGARDTLWAFRPAVFACVADEVHLSTAAGKLRDFGYHCWRVDTPRYRPDNFNRREDDIFSGSIVHAVIAIPEESTSMRPLSGLVPLD